MKRSTRDHISSCLLLWALCQGFHTLTVDAFMTQTRRASTLTRQAFPSRNRVTARTKLEAAQYKHALAILTMPDSSMDRISNEAILETILPLTSKLSIELRCHGPAPSLAALRRYAGEVYSQLWDCVVVKNQGQFLPDVVVYPQNLPNAPPESWIDIQPDLEAICSLDTFIGWSSEGATGRGQRFLTGPGSGGLADHVTATNSERTYRGLGTVEAVTVKPLNHATNVVFLDDDEEDRKDNVSSGYDDDEPANGSLLGGARTTKQPLYNTVAVGGTFDGLHFGHRKLLTLAISAVSPSTGKLLVGVTGDEMLQKKELAELIPPLSERMATVESFLHRLAPGLINRIQVLPIQDAFGPPGSRPEFDALVLSHETLATGQLLNEHRMQQGMKPLALLCTRRTEAHGMSSTTLRKFRKESNTASK